LKQKASQYPVFQYPGKPKFTSQFTGFSRIRQQEQLRHSWKVNCLAPKVNPFFGSLLITIFQKQNYLNIKK